MTVDALLLQASASAIPLKDETVQCVVTSPPYWGLRAYSGEQTVAWPDGTCHPLGLEPTPELYVKHMVEVFREVRRVLRRDGTLWLNLGDSYASYWGSQQGATGQMASRTVTTARLSGRGAKGLGGSWSLKPKDLVGIPWRVAFALQADGWYLRSDIIWHKPNPMPESVTDRPTKAHEYLFLLTKSPTYFYDADAVREEQTTPAGTVRAFRTSARYTNQGHAPDNGSHAGALPEAGEFSGRNKRTVWTIPTRPYPGAHFATFPEDLVEPCILAGSSPKACGICGAPWERDIERVGGPPPGDHRKREDGVTGGKTAHDTGTLAGSHLSNVYKEYGYAQRITTGWRSTCDHDDDSGHSLVLDPFNGSGTTGRVAVRHGRSYVGLDISREYLAQQATKRIDNIQMEAAL